MSWNLKGTTANEGDLALLVGLRHKHFIVKLKVGGTLHTHRGIVSHDDLVGKPWGSYIQSHNGAPFYLLQPALADILRSDGFEIVGEASTGVEAVTKYKELSPDLVTMDVIMPDMGGIDAVKQILEHDPDAKVMMCSAMGQQALVIEAIQAGAKDFVVKPFHPSRVLEAARRIIK